MKNVCDNFYVGQINVLNLTSRVVTLFKTICVGRLADAKILMLFL